MHWCIYNINALNRPNLSFFFKRIKIENGLHDLVLEVVPSLEVGLPSHLLVSTLIGGEETHPLYPPQQRGGVKGVVVGEDKFHILMFGYISARGLVVWG